jgi:hypothetical protein
MKTPQEAMALLIDCMSNRSGQSYKVRNLLYSLWNGQATGSLIELRALDGEIRFALCVVFLRFGIDFEYDDISGPIKKAGLFDWFIEEFQPERTA